MSFIPGTTRSTIQTPNNLDLLYLGEFPSDPTSDVAYHLAYYFNYNIQLLDTVVTRVGAIEPKVEIINDSGLSSKFLYGGTF